MDSPSPQSIPDSRSVFRGYTADSVINFIARGASIVVEWPIAKLPNRSTSASNRLVLSATIDIAETFST
jgi:hypothetical protein